MGEFLGLVVLLVLLAIVLLICDFKGLFGSPGSGIRWLKSVFDVEKGGGGG
jgi:hypothetical protein